MYPVVDYIPVGSIPIKVAALFVFDQDVDKMHHFNPSSVREG
jgi:hypothetical protein